MPEPITEQSTDQNPQQAGGPNIDAELDAALSKKFTAQINQPTEKPIEKVVQPVQAKKEEVKTEEIKHEEVKVDSKKSSKPVENEKPLLTPEEVEKMDPKRQDGWTAIKNANKRAHSMIEQRDSEIKKLKETLAEKGAVSQKELEALKSENDENKKYRAMIELESDPEFISSYDKPIETSIESIKKLVMDLGVSRETVDNPESIDFKNTASLERLINLVTQNKDRFTAAKIENKIKDYLALYDKRNETLESQKNNYKQTLEEKKKQSFAKGAEAEGRMMKHLELKATEKNKDGKPMIPFLNKLEVPENAQQADIDQINNHNGLVEMMTQKLQEVSKMNEPEHRAEINIAAVGAHYFKSLSDALAKENQKLKEELHKISSVSSETPSRKPNNPTGRNGRNGDEILDTDQALASHFSGRGR